MITSLHRHFHIDLLHHVLQIHPILVDALKDAGKRSSRQHLLALGGNKGSQLPGGWAMLDQESGNHLLGHL